MICIGGLINGYEWRTTINCIDNRLSAYILICLQFIAEYNKIQKKNVEMPFRYLCRLLYVYELLE